MKRSMPQLAKESSADPAPSEEAPANEIKELWFALARRYWASIVLLPAGATGSTAGLARLLAEVGTRLREAPVTTIVAEPLDYASAARIAATVGATGQVTKARPVATPIEAIVAIPPVVVEPLGAAIAQAADATILCIELRRTRMAEVRHAVELVGRERIAGCLLLR
jgi:hypothetical protein